MEKPIFHIILNDQDRWAVEAEWYDGTFHSGFFHRRIFTAA
jgi:hypothetical protein